MNKTAHFASRRFDHWPRPDEIEHYFLGPPGRRWFFETRNDTAEFGGDGVDNTDHLPPGKGRTYVRLSLVGHPALGVLLSWSKWNSREGLDYHSKGDLSRLREPVFSLHGDALSAGLFIPFDRAWRAVKEFLETDGQLPKSIEWVDDRDFPPDTFPDPDISGPKIS